MNTFNLESDGRAKTRALVISLMVLALGLVAFWGRTDVDLFPRLILLGLYALLAWRFKPNFVSLFVFGSCAFMIIEPLWRGQEIVFENRVWISQIIAAAMLTQAVCFFKGSSSPSEAFANWNIPKKMLMLTLFLCAFLSLIGKLYPSEFEAGKPLIGVVFSFAVWMAWLTALAQTLIVLAFRLHCRAAKYQRRVAFLGKESIDGQMHMLGPITVYLAISQTFKGVITVLISYTHAPGATAVMHFAVSPEITPLMDLGLAQAGYELVKIPGQLVALFQTDGNPNEWIVTVEDAGVVATHSTEGEITGFSQASFVIEAWQRPFTSDLKG